MSTTEQPTSTRLGVNGRDVDIDVESGETLIETLRGMGLHSVRGACGIGVCGSCTVQLDGQAVSSCIMLTAQAEGRQVRTCEGLVGDDDSLDPVQDAFVRNTAYQCSFCIPGIVMTVRALLDRGDPVTVEAAREELGGNLCRCGTYPWILQAVTDLIKQEETQ
jgi:aerobic-type carbon monoxide dehydrogenase small subunit (CoxS/CutS family)